MPRSLWTWLSLDVSIKVIPVTPKWQKHEMPATAPEGSKQAVVYVSVHEDSRVWFDDFSLKSYRQQFPDVDTFAYCLDLRAEESERQLGPGWYKVEEDSEKRWRWMSKEGSLLIRTEPGKSTLQIVGDAVTKHLQTGHVLLQTFVNGDLLNESLLEDGGFDLSFQVPQSVLVEPMAKIDLKLDTAFVPNTYYNNGDLRELGIIVESVCFK